MPESDRDVPATSNGGTGLRRRLGLAALIAYGVGDILGAGIYALVGKVTGQAGVWGWLSFLVAMGIASLTGLSYAELVTRFPRSGGEAHFCQRAFGRRWLSTLVGWLVLCSGIVSMGAVAHAFAGYLHGLQPDWPDRPLQLAFLCILAGITFVGIREASAANIVFTLIEAAGLLFVLATGLVFLADGDAAMAGGGNEAAVGFSWLAVMQGATLAFYAFIGFEDMANVAEEVHEPERVFPAALLWSVAIAGGLYVAVALVAVAVVPPAELAAAEAPLLEVVRVAAPWTPPASFTIVALFAVSNTGLLNFVMASRLVYGMAQDKLVPTVLSRVHAGRGTPHMAIAVVLMVTAALSLTGTLSELAATTSVLILTAFLMVNLSLLRIRLSEVTPVESFQVPLFVPVLAAASCVGLACFVAPTTFLRAGLLLAVGAVIVLIQTLRGHGAIPQGRSH